MGARNINAERNVSLAGFAVDVIGSNIIMSADEIPKDNSFVLGILAYQLINPLFYIAKHELDGHGDLEAYERHGGDAVPIELGLIINSAFNLYRLYRDPGFRAFVRITKEETSIVLKWEF